MELSRTRLSIHEGSRQRGRQQVELKKKEHANNWEDMIHRRQQ